jgi:glycosyltransferase involved in cell wall biosynthesis
VEGEVTAFQSGGGGGRGRVLRQLRDLAIHRAAHVVCPSAFMRELVISWGIPASDVTLLPNPAPRVTDVAAAEFSERPTLVFAGRLTAQKDLDVALEALAGLPGLHLVVVGDGPERARLEAQAHERGVDGRVRFTGSLPRSEALSLLRGADAAILTSAWENFPHGVVEALAVGTPVIATRTGGVSEVVTDGENGLLVPPGDPPAFAAAVSRFVADGHLRERLRAAAAPSVAVYDPDRVYGRLEAILAEASSR